ncbi:MAG: flagellar filament capping protein FliD, partial [Peptostreptococcaceae bacterium]|nr:flagellar filament capping protein FliD [Peptostreptococcaceae bacterium]
SIVDSSGNPSNALSFLVSKNTDQGINSEIEVKSKDGSFSDILKQESNSFTIDGINYSVHAEGSADISSSQDVEPVVENMKKFAEDYNKIMDKVYGLVTEKKNKDFPPLTDAQKEDMKEEEIEKWEKKAKVGLLRNDSEMRTFMDHMQNAIFGENTKFLNECGLTSSEDYTKKGQLSLDEDKFKKALQNNSQKVYDAFAGGNDSVLEKMKDTMYDYVGTSSSVFAKKAGLEKTSSVVNNFYSEQIKRQEDAIKLLQRKMDDRENKLYKQFGQLEASMNKLNSQMNYFAQM